MARTVDSMIARRIKADPTRTIAQTGKIPQTLLRAICCHFFNWGFSETARAAVLI